MKFQTAKRFEQFFPASHGGLFSVTIPKENVIDFSSNVNPLGPSVSVKQAFLAKDIPIYPDSDSIKLKEKLSKYLKLPQSQITIGNGATEIIYNFSKIFLEKKRVLIPVPTFAEYESSLKLADAKMTFFQTLNLNDDIDEFIKKIAKNGGVFVCNPNNPTGVITTKQNIIKIIATAQKRKTLVFVDECFMELIWSKSQSVVDQIKKFDNLFVLRSFTKSFGLAGMRIGYGLANKKLIELVEKIKLPWNVSGVSQHMAIAALKDKSHLKKTSHIIKKESQFLSDQIMKNQNFFCFPTQTNFILIKSKINSKILQKRLYAKKILIRDCSTIRGLDASFFRIAVRTHKENKSLIEELQKL